MNGCFSPLNVPFSPCHRGEVRPSRGEGVRVGPRFLGCEKTEPGAAAAQHLAVAVGQGGAHGGTSSAGAFGQRLQSTRRQVRPECCVRRFCLPVAAARV
jgi:hypothetical protein